VFDHSVSREFTQMPHHHVSQINTLSLKRRGSPCCLKCLFLSANGASGFGRMIGQPEANGADFIFQVARHLAEIDTNNLAT